MLKSSHCRSLCRLGGSKPIRLRRAPVVFVKNQNGVETLELTERFGYWFHPQLRTDAGRASGLPIDQHFLQAVVTLRALICADPQADRSTFGGHHSPRENWEAILDDADSLPRGKRLAKFNG